MAEKNEKLTDLEKVSYNNILRGVDKPVDYYKAIAKNPVWNNKKAAVIMVNIKISKQAKKVPFAIIPCKKWKDAKDVFEKEFKVDKEKSKAGLSVKKIAAGLISYEKTDEGLVAKFTKVPGKGNATNKDLEKAGADFFKKFRNCIAFKVSEGTEDAADAADSADDTADTKAVDPKALLTKLEDKYKDVVAAVQAKKPAQEVADLATKWINNFKKVATDASKELKAKAAKVQGLLDKVAKREQGGAPKGDDKATKQLDDIQGQIDKLIKNLGGASELKKMAGL